MLRWSIMLAVVLMCALAPKASPQQADEASEKRDSAKAQLWWAHEARIKASNGPIHSREDFLEAVRRYELVEKYYPQDAQAVFTAKTQIAYVNVLGLDEHEVGRTIILDLIETPEVKASLENMRSCLEILQAADAIEGEVSAQAMRVMTAKAKEDPAIANCVDLHRVYMACATALRNNDPKALDEAEEILANMLLRAEGTLEELIIAKEILKQIPIYRVAIREHVRMEENSTKEWSRTGQLILPGARVSKTLAAGDRYSFSRMLSSEDDPTAIEPFVMGRRQQVISELHRFFTELRTPEALEAPSFTVAVTVARRIRALELRPELERILNIAVTDEQRMFIKEALGHIGKPAEDA